VFAVVDTKISSHFIKSRVFLDRMSDFNFSRRIVSYSWSSRITINFSRRIVSYSQSSRVTMMTTASDTTVLYGRD
jgi:hypothetical protein